MRNLGKKKFPVWTLNQLMSDELIEGNNVHGLTLAGLLNAPISFNTADGELELLSFYLSKDGELCIDLELPESRLSAFAKRVDSARNRKRNR